MADSEVRQKFEATVKDLSETLDKLRPGTGPGVGVLLMMAWDEAYSAGMRAGEIARWIPVEEKLPEIGQEVLAGAFIQCEFRDGRQTVSWQHCLQMWTGEKWIDADSGVEDGASHWQPLPAAPEEKK